MGTNDKLTNQGCRGTVREKEKIGTYFYTFKVKKRGLTVLRYVHVSETESMTNWQAYRQSTVFFNTGLRF